MSAALQRHNGRLAGPVHLAQAVPGIKTEILIHHPLHEGDEVMHAVVRETSYSPEAPIYKTQQFQEFQKEHANLNGYQGTVLVEVGDGRFLTLTLWQTAEDMIAAREAMGPVVERTVNPLMTSRAKLLGTGPVVFDDLART
jgi:hypothetical protein